jgi:hypothetical protein
MLQYINWYIGLIGLGMLLSIPNFLNINKSYKKGHLIVFCILLLAFSLEIAGYYMSNNGIPNVIYYNLFFVHLETYLILYLFSIVFDSKKTTRWLIAAGLALFLSGIIISLFFQTINLFQTYSYALASIFIIFISIYFYYTIIFQNKYQDIQLVNLPYFWIISFVFFFYSASFLFFISTNIWLKLDIQLYYSLSLMNQILAGMMYLIMGLAFYVSFLFKGREAEEMLDEKIDNQQGIKTNE